MGRRRSALQLVILVGATFVAFWPSLHGGFIWDDELLLTKNALVKASDGLFRMWFTREPIDYWPLTNTSFWVEWRLWGMHPTGYHVTNLALHIANAALIWKILERLKIPGAFLAALLFALHPVNVESVAWIAQRKNTLSLFFFLVSTRLFLQSSIANRQSPMSYWLSFLAFVLAMLSKGSVVVLPVVLLLLAWWERDRVTARDLRAVAPFLAAGVALTLVNVWFQTHGSQHEIRDVTWLQRLLGAGAVPWFYLLKATVPTGLSFVYPQWNIATADWRWWVPLAGTVLLTVLLVLERRRAVGRTLLFAWLFFCVALVPVMGFTDVYYMKYSLVADHYQYIAIIAVTALVGAGVDLLTKKPAGPQGDPAGHVLGTRRT